MNTFERIFAAVKMIPRGYVMTYGGVAALAGNPRMARVVGYALHQNPAPGVIPCHRVVNREGRLAPAFAFGGDEAVPYSFHQERSKSWTVLCVFSPPKAAPLT